MMDKWKPGGCRVNPDLKAKKFEKKG